MARKHVGISVLIAIPQSITRELLMGALRRSGKFNVFDNAATSLEVVKAVRSMKVDIALISANLADGPMSGFGALRKVHESSPEAKCIILHDGNQNHLAVDAFRAGAKGVFCLSQSNFKALCRCVEQVHAGHIWANSKELSEIIDAFYQLAPMRVVNADGMRLLTKREEEVVRLLAEGLQNREIAHELNLSEHTIKNYVFHIFDKLGVSSRVELVLYAISSSKRAGEGEVYDGKDELVENQPLEVKPFADDISAMSRRSRGKSPPADQ